MADITPNDIILAAVAASGDMNDADYQERLTANVMEMAILLDEKSYNYKRMIGTIDMIRNCKVFTGTVLDCYKEKSSTRGFVTLYTGTKQKVDGVPMGCETGRTERTDRADGLAMAKRFQSLVGQDVVVHVQLETDKNNPRQKYRTLRHVMAMDREPSDEAMDMVEAFEKKRAARRKG